MHAPFVTPPFSPCPAAAGSEVLDAHPSSGSSAATGARSLRDPRFPECHPYCAGSVHVIGCKNVRPRRDDDWQRRADYEEGIRG